MRNRGCDHPKTLHLSCSCSSVGFLPQVPALHELLQGGSFPGVTCDPCRSCDLCQQTCASMGSSPWAVCGLQPPSGLALLWLRLSAGCRVDESRCLHHGSPWAEGSLLSSALLHRLQGSSALTPKPPPPPPSSSWRLQSCSSLFPLTPLSELPHSFFYPFLQQL